MLLRFHTSPTFRANWHYEWNHDVHAANLHRIEASAALTTRLLDSRAGRFPYFRAVYSILECTYGREGLAFNCHYRRSGYQPRLVFWVIGRNARRFQLGATGLTGRRLGAVGVGYLAKGVYTLLYNDLFFGLLWLFFRLAHAFRC